MKILNADPVRIAAVREDRRGVVGIALAIHDERLVVMPNRQIGYAVRVRVGHVIAEQVNIGVAVLKYIRRRFAVAHVPAPTNWLESGGRIEDGGRSGFFHDGFIGPNGGLARGGENQGCDPPIVPSYPMSRHEKRHPRAFDRKQDWASNFSHPRHQIRSRVSPKTAPETGQQNEGGLRAIRTPRPGWRPLLVVRAGARRIRRTPTAGTAGPIKTTGPTRAALQESAKLFELICSEDRPKLALDFLFKLGDLLLLAVGQ